MIRLQQVLISLLMETLFYVNNTSNYNIGDVLTYDGSIIADDTNINIIILTSIVGKVTGIIDEHTVALFKF